MQIIELFALLYILDAIVWAVIVLISYLGLLLLSKDTLTIKEVCGIIIHGTNVVFCILAALATIVAFAPDIKRIMSPALEMLTYLAIIAVGILLAKVYIKVFDLRLWIKNHF